MAKFHWRYLRRFAVVGALILLFRRLVRSRKIQRVLVDTAAVRAHYQLPVSDLVHLASAHVSAQPIAVVGSDRVLLWAFSPQLKRHPTTADVLWRSLAPPRSVAGQTLFAAVDGFSYYHWLTGTLPKILFAARAGLNLESVQTIVVNPKHKGRVNFQTETLALLGLSLNNILFIDRGVHLVCDTLILPPEPTAQEQTDVHPWALSLVREAFLPLARQNASLGSPRRLFIRRAAARRRRLLDEDLIEQKLADCGFVGVTLEAMAWQEQVALFRDAEVIVGLHGAGLSNLLFSSPGTRLVEILPDAWRNPCFKNLSRRIGGRYASVPARAVGEKKGFAADARVDLDRLLAAIHSR